MKAAYRTSYGNQEVLQIKELPVPGPSENDVIIKVTATTVNRTDCANLTGKPLIMQLIMGLVTPKFPVPGTDFTGEIVEVGKNAKRFKPGDRVWGFDDSGKAASQAEYMIFNENRGIELMPDSMNPIEGVACIEGVHYAYNFINKVSLKPGQKAMVNGGTGAIGSALIQMLKHHGLSVTATCRGEHADIVKELGAHRIIDYTSADFTKENEIYDYVFDAVGKSSFGKCKRLLSGRGIYISSELGPNYENPFLAMIAPISSGRKVKFPIPLNINESLKYSAELISKGAFKPLIDRMYSLEEVKEAYAYVLSGQKTGNVILKVQNPET